MVEWIIVNDKMQTGYKYALTCPFGQEFHPDFKPQLTPQQMLELGVFGGKYMTDCREEFPQSWFENAKLSPSFADANKNYFGILASKPLSYWLQKGWVTDTDPRGWFQWYCRYYQGRRLGGEDNWQIKRWKAMQRHIAQVRKNCERGDFFCRPRQRQALMQWAYDSRLI